MFKPTAFVLLAGLAVAQAPPPGIPQEDVKRVANRLAALDSAFAPPITAQQLDALRKMLEANPELKKEVERRVKDFQSLPPDQQKAKLDELQKSIDNPAIKKQLEQLTPGNGKQSPTHPRATPPTNREPSPDGRTTKPAPTPETEPPRVKGQSRVPTERPAGQDGPPPQPPPGLRPKPPATNGGGGYEKFARLWARNVGPLDDMPAVRELAQELFKGRADAPAGGEGGALGELFDPKTAGNLLKSLPETGGDRGGWHLPDFSGALGDMDRPALPQGGLSAPSLPSAGGIGGVLGLLAVVGVVVTLIVLLPRLRGGVDPTPVPGLGPWPIDPRAVETRADLVRAFDYLSVLLNGQPARAYSHEAAAAALRQAVPTAADAADPLAALYALARYTPADYPLAPDELATARNHLCRLAGVPAT